MRTAVLESHISGQTYDKLYSGPWITSGMDNKFPDIFVKEVIDLYRRTHGDITT